MPTDPEHALPSSWDDERTAVLDAVPGAPVGYGDRFAEDAFDYPSSSASRDWSAETALASDVVAGATAVAQQRAAGVRGTGRGGARGADGWQRVGVRHRSALTARCGRAAAGRFRVRSVHGQRHRLLRPHPGRHRAGLRANLTDREAAAAGYLGHRWAWCRRGRHCRAGTDKSVAGHRRGPGPCRGSRAGRAGRRGRRRRRRLNPRSASPAVPSSRPAVRPDNTPHRSPDGTRLSTVVPYVSLDPGGFL